jgi:hypothetical protein
VRWGYNPVCKRWIENKRKKEKEKQGKGRRKRIKKKQDRRNREIARANKGMNYIRRKIGEKITINRKIEVSIPC